MLLFESFKNIESICRKYGIEEYTINPDGTLDVDGSVDLSGKDLTKLPLKFRRVTDHFNCSWNQLTSLEGSPKYVGGSFNCNGNKLMTLEGSPKYVRGSFNCNGNKLITLEGGPKEVSGYFYCEGNLIHSIYRLFPDYKSFRDSLDYGFLRGTNIVRTRFKEALEEIGKEVPKSIHGYKYI